MVGAKERIGGHDAGADEDVVRDKSKPVAYGVDGGEEEDAPPPSVIVPQAPERSTSHSSNGPISSVSSETKSAKYAVSFAISSWMMLKISVRKNQREIRVSITYSCLRTSPSGILLNTSTGTVSFHGFLSSVADLVSFLDRLD